MMDRETAKDLLDKAAAARDEARARLGSDMAAGLQPSSQTQLDAKLTEDKYWEAFSVWSKL